MPERMHYTVKYSKNFKLPINPVAAAGIIVDGLNSHFPEWSFDFLFGEEFYTFVGDVCLNGERWQCAKLLNVWSLKNVQPHTNLEHMIDLFQSEPKPA